MVGNTAWGMYNFRSGLMRELLESGNRVSVLAPFDASFSKKIMALGCRFIPVKIAARGTNPLVDALLILRLLMIYRKIKPDIVFHYTIKPNIYGSIACRLARIPSVAITTGLGYTFIHRNTIASIARYLYKLAFKKVQLICFLNEEDKRVLVSTGIVQKEKTKVLKGEGIDLAHYSPDATPIQNMPGSCFTLFGRLIKEKGVFEFVEAARLIKQRHPNVDFHLLGYLGVENPGAISKEQVAKWEQEGTITYLGSTEDIRPYIAQSTCIVLPSYYKEGIPRSLLEAAAMAKPIITTNNIGCKEVIEDGVTGFLCRGASVDSLKQAMEKILALSAEERIEMGKKGRLKVKQEFDEHLIFKEYLDMIYTFS